jgi:N-acyl-D-aspartate/D-glutamate deacylase
MTAPAETLIQNAIIYDGSGSLPVIADVAMARGRILKVGPRLQYSAAITIEAHGLALAPGFIDTHTHDEMHEAIRRMTFLPAMTFGISQRGRIGEGFHADLVLFDPETVRDAATFEQPKVPSLGIAKVWVNGHCVWDNGNRTTARPGEVLRPKPLTIVP